MPVIQVNKYSTHIQELNKEAIETVLMVHGMLSNLSMYYFSVAPILAEQFHVVMYDLKGHGMSERVLNGYDLNSMTDDLVALMATLGLTKVHLVGHSFGGLIALKMVARFPEKIKKLAIVEAPNPNDDKTRNFMSEYSRELFNTYLNHAGEGIHLKMGKRQAERSHHQCDFLFHQTSLKNDMLLERDFFSKQEIDRIPHEVLLIYGTDSLCYEAGKYLQGRIKNSIFSLIKGGHNLPIQAPVIVGTMVKAFFEK